MSKLGYLLGGAVLGAIGLGLASYLTVKFTGSSPEDVSSLDNDDEAIQEALCENAVEQQTDIGEAHAEATA